MSASRHSTVVCARDSTPVQDIQKREILTNVSCCGDIAGAHGFSRLKGVRLMKGHTKSSFSTLKPRACA